MSTDFSDFSDMGITTLFPTSENENIQVSLFLFTMKYYLVFPLFNLRESEIANRNARFSKQKLAVIDWSSQLSEVFLQND